MEAQRNSNFDGDWDAQCMFCGRPHREHIWNEHPDPNYKHRMPCEKEKAAMRKKQKRIAMTAKSFVFFGWILVPILILVVGFASYWLGVLLFIVSLFQIGWMAIKLCGHPEKWVPGYKEKKEQELRKAHYIYHCERNPKGFERLKAENLQEEITNNE